MEPILEVEEGPELVSSLLDKQVLDDRQRELTAAELRVHVPINNDESQSTCARLWHKKPPADPLGFDGHNAALFLKLFFFSHMTSLLRPTARLGLSAFTLASRIGPKTKIPLGLPHSMFLSISDQ